MNKGLDSLPSELRVHIFKFLFNGLTDTWKQDENTKLLQAAIDIASQSPRWCGEIRYVLQPIYDQLVEKDLDVPFSGFRGFNDFPLFDDLWMRPDSHIIYERLYNQFEGWYTSRMSHGLHLVTSTYDGLNMAWEWKTEAVLHIEMVIDALTVWQAQRKSATEREAARRDCNKALKDIQTVQVYSGPRDIIY